MLLVGGKRTEGAAATVRKAVQISEFSPHVHAVCGQTWSRDFAPLLGSLARSCENQSKRLNVVGSKQEVLHSQSLVAGGCATFHLQSTSDCLARSGGKTCTWMDSLVRR